MRIKSTPTPSFDERRGTTKKLGFSLIELIVVITIIAIITAIATVSFGTTNRKARDGRRQADLERIRMALEVVRQVGTTYPDDSSISVLTSGGFLSAYPVGPSSDTYVYDRQTNYTYFLYARMETGTTIATAVSCTTGNCNYRVTQP
ncbi:MAG: prepilin-type N-terminal cleavage/methylation domain-containing protein [Candidatus Shapirobacteria bacterium]|jgi:type IV pilus assembly protein PilE